MLSCRVCGFENSQDISHCAGCGAFLGKACLQCSATVEPSMNFCPNCGAPTRSEASSPTTDVPAAQEKSDSLPGERRRLTLVFCDLVGSTRLSQTLDPEDYSAVINEYRKSCHKCVVEYGGYVAQFLGDGMLVYFGFPQAHEDAPYRAVCASLDMLKSIERLNSSLKARFHITIQIRIGIHVGVVVLERSVAGRDRLAMGDAPNIASRLQGLAHPNSVVISSAVESSIRDQFIIEDAGLQQMPGVINPTQVFRVTGRHYRRIGALGGAARGRSELIGRDGEFESLAAVWERVLGGPRSEVAIIRGEPGIGKSRLVEELIDHVQPEAKTIEFRCSPIFRRSPLQPLVESMSESFGFAADDSIETRRARLREGLTRASLAENVSLFETLLLPIEVSSPQLPPTPNPDNWKTLQSALLTWLRYQIDGRPTLLIWEDVHWIDSLSLKLLSSIHTELAELPLLVLVTSREEVSLAGPGITDLHLDPLTAKESSDLIENVIAGNPLSQGLKNQLMIRGEGIPLFLNELTRMVLDVRLTPTPRASGELAIPATLQDLLLARLDRLARKTALCFAAALGREFDYGLLSTVAALSQEELDAELDELLDDGILVRSTTTSRTIYAFSHALFQEAAYNSMLRSFRRSVHARIGDRLSDLLRFGLSAGGREPGELLPSLAYHWTRAVDRNDPNPERAEKAAGFLIQSADMQLTVSGYSECESQLIEARGLLELFPPSRRRDEIELGIEVRLSTVFKVKLGWASSEVKSAYDRSYELCTRLGNRPEIAQVLYGQWSYYLGQGRITESLTAAHELSQLGGLNSSSNFGVQARAALANSQFWNCRLQECVESAEEGLGDYTVSFLETDLKSFGQDPRIHALQSLTWSLWLLGRVDSARRRCDHAIQLAEETGHPFGLANALLTKCNLDLLRRDHFGVAQAADRLRELSQNHGFIEYSFRAEFFHAWYRACIGESAAVLQNICDGYELFRSHGGVARTLAAWVTADILRMAGQHVRSLEILEEALVAWTQEEVVYEAGLHWMKGRVLAERSVGEQAEAEASLTRSIELATARGQVPIAMRSTVELYRLGRRNRIQVELPVDRLQDHLRRFEGADEPDLLDARSLLVELTSH